MARSTQPISEPSGDPTLLAAIGSTEDPAPESPEEMPLPRNLQTLLLLGIFTLLLFYALYLAGSIVLPIIFAGVLYLVLQPAMRAAAKFHIPKAVAALLIILIVIGGVGALGVTLSGPAADWIAKAPDSLRRIDAQLFLLKQPPDLVLLLFIFKPKFKNLPGVNF